MWCLKVIKEGGFDKSSYVFFYVVTSDSGLVFFFFSIRPLLRYMCFICAVIMVIKVNDCLLFPCLKIGVYTLYGKWIQFPIWACSVQMAPVASSTDWKAAYHLGLQDSLPGCALPISCWQILVCGCWSGKLLKARF